MATSTITAIHERRARAMRRNLFSVALSAQRQTICPHDDGRARAPIRRQAEDGSWGWWLPHPIRREVWDFVAEDLPNPRPALVVLDSRERPRDIRERLRRPRRAGAQPGDAQPDRVADDAVQRRGILRVYLRRRGGPLRAGYRLHLAHRAARGRSAPL